MDNAAVGIFLLTSVGEIEYANKKVEEMLNYDAEELALLSNRGNFHLNKN